MANDALFSPIQPSEHEAVAALLHRSLVDWYESRLRQGFRFGTSPEPFRLIPSVYEVLDPGEGLAARDRATGALLGVCFVHPRRTHLSIGLVATAAEAQGRGIARALIEPVLARARAASLPVRLVSSLLNLDSFSLYTRLGFVPQEIYQDMTLRVPAEGLPATPPPGVSRTRRARSDEAARIARFEFELRGIHREPDHHFFLNPTAGRWAVWVHESSVGEIDGMMVASTHPDHVMVGPGAATDDAVAAALLWRALDGLRGASPVILVPCAAADLVRTLYRWGARNVELHVTQVCGAVAPAHGLAFPTFLPESG